MRRSARGARRLGRLALTLSVVVAAGGGWALAATTAPAGVIHACAAKQGGVLRLSVTCNRRERAVTWNVQGVPGTNGTSGNNGTNGADGANGSPGAPGTARAFGLVDVNGKLTRSKNATVTHVATGTYCITLAPGIDAKTTGIIATPDFGDDTTQPGAGPDNSAHIEFNSTGSCPPNSLAVQTFEVNNANSGGDHYDIEFGDEAFFFAVP
jgi:hypothetical protein